MGPDNEHRLLIEYCMNWKIQVILEKFILSTEIYQLNISTWMPLVTFTEKFRLEYIENKL